MTRYVRHLNADDIARILDGADHAEPEETPSDALFCFAVGALAALIVVAVLIYVQIGGGQ
jgi:hypothetical protein